MDEENIPGLGRMSEIDAPATDRILFYDVSLCRWRLLELGANLTIVDDVINATGGGGGGGEIPDGSIDEVKLDVSVNASLDLADSSLQPASIGSIVQAYSAVLAATEAAYTTAKDTKLAGIAPGATANATDAQLRDRSTHTGSQAQSTITNLVTDLAAKAPLASPALTGTPTVPTAPNATSNTQAASTAFVHAVVADLIAAAPTLLNDLNEIAAAIGDDPNFAATITTLIGEKLAKASNLSDLTDAAAARTNLGLVIGTNVQAFDADLAAIAGLATQAFGRSLLTAVDAAAVRSSLSLGAVALLASIATANIDNDAVTNLKLANMATATFKGRTTAGAGDPEDLTAAQATAMLDAFTSSLKGLVPASGGGTSNFLRADGSWAAPGGGSDPWTYVKLGSDFTTSSASAVDVTGMAFTPSANQTYVIEGHFLLRTATATIGPRPGVAWPTGMSDGAADMYVPTSASAEAQQHGNIAAAVLTPVGGLPTTTGSYGSQMLATLVAGASPSGTFKIQLASETAGTNVTMKAGSWIRYRTI